MPRAHTGSVNHVRLCAIRPSFSHCRLSRLELSGDDAGPAEEASSFCFSAPFPFLFLFFLSGLYVSAPVAIVVAAPAPVGAAAHARDRC